MKKLLTLVLGGILAAAKGTNRSHEKGGKMRGLVIALILLCCGNDCFAYSGTHVTVGHYSWQLVLDIAMAENPSKVLCSLWKIEPKPTGDLIIPESFSVRWGRTQTWHLACIGLVFWNCAGLTSVTIPDSVEKLGYSQVGPFCGCGDLKSVTIGKNVSFIAADSFSQCRKLETITFKGDAPSYVGSSAFYQCGVDTTRHPAGYTVVRIPESNKTYRVNSTWIDTHAGRKEVLMWNGLVVEYYKSNNSGGNSASGSGNGGTTIADIWKKVRILNSVVRDGESDDVVGMMQIKIGKASKGGVVSVSGTITTLDGKKLRAKGGKFSVENNDGREFLEATLAVKDGTKAKITVDEDGFYGEWGDDYIESGYDVGGDWTRDGAKVYVDATSLPAGTITELLPDGEPVIPKGGRWAFNKAATVKLSKDKTKDERDTSKGKTNLSGLKLAYTPKKGTFKGSFKVYALEGAGKTTKLKKYTVNVTGLVVDGVGYGVATCKKPTLRWSVSVR